jgi:hypothetical protein
MSNGDLIRRLQESARRRPFEPFDLEWPGGDRLTFDDPEALAFRDGVAIYIDPQGACTLLDARGARRLSAAERPPRGAQRTTVAALLVVHLLGICGSVLGATIEIESIVGTGPAFSLLGLLVAESGRRCRARGVFWLGMSTLALSLVVLGLINLAEWGPAQARTPVSVILLVYEGLAVPLGLMAMWRLFAPLPVAGRASWQFDLWAVIRFTCLLAVGLAAGRAASDLGLPPPPAVATGMLVAALTALAWIGYRTRHP